MHRARLRPSRTAWSAQIATSIVPIVLIVLMATIFLLHPGTASAQTWSEVGDAGSVPVSAQSTAGSSGLTQITGTLPVDSDVDMYCFRIANFSSFSARLTCAAISEPDIFLFNGAGKGVSLNELCSTGAKTISNAFVAGNGMYYLAIAAHGAIPYSGPNNIWFAGVTSERAPDGPGAGGPVTAWGGSPVTIPPFTYSVLLQGASPCNFITRAAERTWGRVRSSYR